MSVQAALACQALGLSIIPIRRDNKRPYLEAWKPFQTKPADQPQLQKWWRDFPDANVGVVTGFLSGVFVIDVDGGDGPETLAQWQRDNEPLPATWRTRTGRGEHIWFRFPAGVEIRNSQGDLAKGLDVRGEGGYVIAPGSTHASGSRYEWQDDCSPEFVELATAPDWLLEKVRKHEKPKPQPRTNGHAQHAPTDQRYYELCRRIFEEERTLVARSGEGQRNGQLNKSAFALAQLAHYGAYGESEVSASLEGACLQNGYIQQDGAPAFHASFSSGWKAGLAEPRELTLRERRAPPHERPDPRPEPPLAEPDDGREPDLPTVDQDWAQRVDLEQLWTVPPRQWLYGVKLIRGFTTLLVSPGGVGKTAYTFGVACACATGAQLLHDKPHGALNVWLYNLEDPYDELRRRLAAVLLHFGASIDTGALEQRLFINSGKERGLLIAVREADDTVTVCEDSRALVAELIRMKIDVLIIDPFIMTHQVNENSNTEIERVLREFNSIATEAGCAILLVHHSRKGFVAGDQDSIRGGGSLVGAARAAYTLSPMQPDEAQKLNIKPEDRRFLVRIDDAKMNMAPKSDKAQWIRLESVNLKNGDDEYPRGDNVQVATPWEAPTASDGLTVEIANEILDELERGTSGERYSAYKQSTRAAQKLIVSIMADHGIEQSEKWADEIIAGWLKNSVIRDEEYTSPGQRRPRRGIFVNSYNRPGDRHT